MDLNKRLQERKVPDCPPPREEKLRQTMEACAELSYRLEQGRLLNYGEFLWSQLRYTRKRWWVMQGALLLLAGELLTRMAVDLHRLRMLGLVGCLFVVFLIPELWRNKENGATQIEAACLYSLRQIYAARLTLFGLADVVLLTLFSGRLWTLGFSPLEILRHFLLPVTVTACICLEMLSGKWELGEAASLAASLFWSALWGLVLVNEKLYALVAPSVWLALFAAAVAFLALAVRRTLAGVNRSWEVDFCDITTG